MPDRLLKALIAHLDSVFAGPNGDYPAVLETLAGLTAKQAVWKPAPGHNSIWQIVEHLTASKIWQIEMLEKGQAASPAWTSQHTVDEAAWQASLERLKAAHAKLRGALGKRRDPDLLTIPSGESQTLVELILSASSAHEAHHAGQIDYLKGFQAG